MAVTLRDIAQLAQVSTGTVSRVLNNAEGVGPELRRRVIASAEALHYSPPRQKTKAAPKQGVGAIGFLLMLRTMDQGVPALSPFWGDILHGAERYVRENGGHVIFRGLHDYESPAESVAQIEDLQLDSALVVGPVDAEHVEALNRAGVRTVLVDNTLPEAPCTAVISDNFAGSLAAVDHLLDLGHRDIAFIGGPRIDDIPGTNSITSIHWRALAYRTALRERGIAVRPELVEGCDLSAFGGAAAARRLLEAGARFTAVFCANDPTAVGVIAALREAGIATPEQVSVAGFDDDRAAAAGVMPLTTVRVRREEMGAIAAHALLDQSAPDIPVTITVPVELLVRASTRALPN